MNTDMKYEIVEDRGKYTIRDVPIFQVHDTRFNCDQQWLVDAINNHNRHKERGWLPPIILGHNLRGPAKKEEKRAVGFFDNLRLIGNEVYADLIRIPKWLLDQIRDNAYPSRSCEVLPNSKRITALALLGGTTPYFSLPSLMFDNTDKEQGEWFLYEADSEPEAFHYEELHYEKIVWPPETKVRLKKALRKGRKQGILLGAAPSIWFARKAAQNKRQS